MVLTYSKILFFLCLAFILGVFLASFLLIPQSIAWEVFILSVFYSIFFFKNKRVLIFALCLLAIGAGLLRASVILPQEKASQKESFFPAFKEKLEQNISKSVPFPESTFVLALILGDQSQIPFELKEKLSQSGLRHITAVSGAHIVILTEALVLLGGALKLGRLKANWFGLIVIWLFLFLIGFHSSALRAVIMASSFLMADILGRRKAVLRLVVLTATLMILFNPALLRYDLGFQLSFLAVLGIAYFNSFFKGLLEKVFKKRFAFVTSIMAMTFSAQVFTLPLLFYYFSSASLVSPLTNILVLPIIPYLMGASFIFALFSLFLGHLALVLVLPVWLLAKYLIFIAVFFSALPFASFSLQIHWLWLLPAYLLFFTLAFILQHHQRQHLLP
ncbi:ComEC/Rec2 family competence protein [Candidatus Parcubacteria bacterium]|nr:ComEC/Rec2 family competence protein [Candidatus Parcubacteria bacterium]